jgi:hypothetical protein
MPYPPYDQCERCQKYVEDIKFNKDQGESNYSIAISFPISGQGQNPQAVPYFQAAATYFATCNNLQVEYAAHRRAPHVPGGTN